MAYRPENPVGSTSPKDLMANAENTDLLALGDNPSYPDRMGRHRKSWRGMEKDFSAFLDSSGYEPPVPYATGIDLIRPTQTVTFNGRDYRVKSEFIPLLTTNWVSDEPRLKLVGDNSLRQEMANPNQGAGLSAWKLSKLSKCITSAADALNHLEVPIWAYADKAVGYVEGGDPATWDWGPAFIAADKAIDSISRGGCISVRAGIYGVASECVITGLGKWVKGFGSTATELRAINGYKGDILKFVGSSYCKVTGVKGVGSGGENQKIIYMPYRVDVGVILQNKIDDVQAENCAVGFLLENPVHCTLQDVRTTRDCTLYGLHSQFIAGVGAGQGGTNLRLIGGWFQAHEKTGTACRINSNLAFSSIGSQFEHARYGLVLRACAGATITSPLLEDCGLSMLFQGCTNLAVISPVLDSGTSPDLDISVQALIDIDGGKGIKIIGLTSISDDKPYIDFLVRFSNVSYGVYSTNVLIDEYQSEGNKGVLGGSNVTNLRTVKDGALAMGGALLSGLRVQLPIRTAAPSNPAVGEEFNADGISWNPVTGGRARVVYSGSGIYTKLANF